MLHCMGPGELDLLLSGPARPAYLPLHGFD